MTVSRTGWRLTWARKEEVIAMARKIYPYCHFKKEKIWHLGYGDAKFGTTTPGAYTKELCDKVKEMKYDWQHEPTGAGT